MRRSYRGCTPNDAAPPTSFALLANSRRRGRFQTRRSGAGWFSSHPSLTTTTAPLRCAGGCRSARLRRCSWALARDRGLRLLWRHAPRRMTSVVQQQAWSPGGDSRRRTSMAVGAGRRGSVVAGLETVPPASLLFANVSLSSREDESSSEGAAFSQSDHFLWFMAQF